MASNNVTQVSSPGSQPSPTRVVNDTADLKAIPDFEHPFLSKKTALIVVDFQHDLVDSTEANNPIGSVVSSAAAIIEFGRESHLDIVYTRFLGDARYLGPARLHRDHKYARGHQYLEGSPGAEIHRELRPAADERVFDKKGLFDPFLSQEFDQYVAELGVEHLILVGLDGNLGVDATARSAFQRGLFVTLVKDAIAPAYSEDSARSEQRVSQIYGARLTTSDQLMQMTVGATRGTDLGKPKDSSVWFRPEISSRLADSTRSVFQAWSSLEGEKLEKHLYEIRKLAWQYFEYPCVGQWMFLLPSLSRLPWFPKVVDKLKRESDADGLILDLGTFLGQDLRLLATHGIPTSRMRGLDRDQRPWDLSYDLFLDHDRFKGQFICADFVTDAKIEARAHGLPWQDHTTSMTPFTARKGIVPTTCTSDSYTKFTNEVLKPLQQHQYSVILACQFVHLFSLPEQTVACIRIVQLSRPGTIVIGYQGGRKGGGTSKRPWGTMFHHSAQTWRDMWSVVQMVTGTEWLIEAKEIPFAGWGMPDEDYAWMAGDEMGLDFYCERVK